jgi:gamma-glutamylcyclotransferase (GGCT)/AIG2-like uncharacterized protein YtfP
MQQSSSTLKVQQRYVFVYGTLRRGQSNDINRLSPPPRFLGTAHVAATLYHLGDYPGVVLGGPVMVTGEVYAISASVESSLDAIEGITDSPNDEYCKREIEVVVDGTGFVCLVYELNAQHAKNRPLIESGDWVHFRALPR